MACSGCLKARRAIIHRLPARVAAPLARVLLPSVTTGEAVVREARAWVGVPFLHQGRSRSGLDCLGLPIVVLRALGAAGDEIEFNDYPRFPHSGELERWLNAHCTRLPAPVPGALLALRLSRTLAHSAIVSDTDTLIHALERGRSGGVVEHGFRGLWRTRYAAGAWALPGVRY